MSIGATSVEPELMKIAKHTTTKLLPSPCMSGERRRMAAKSEFFSSVFVALSL
jgi:hypothetical protein